jgi:hypothetical protein
MHRLCRCIRKHVKNPLSYALQTAVTSSISKTWRVLTLYLRRQWYYQHLLVVVLESVACYLYACTGESLLMSSLCRRASASGNHGVLNLYATISHPSFIRSLHDSALYLCPFQATQSTASGLQGHHQSRRNRTSVHTVSSVSMRCKVVHHLFDSRPTAMPAFALRNVVCGRLSKSSLFAMFFGLD